MSNFASSIPLARTFHENFKTLPFDEAAELWLQSRARLSPASIRDYRNCLKPLGRFFGSMRLDEIKIPHVITYQSERRKEVGAVRVNREFIAFGQILSRAGLWEGLKHCYEPLPLPKSTRGICLEPEEQEHLFKLAASRGKWQVAYYAALIARNTCLGTSEMQNLRLANVDLEEHTWIRVTEKTKNDFRVRTLKCNEDAQWALSQLVARARRLGASEAEHFLLPHRAETSEGKADPTRPAYCWHKAWHSLRKEAAKKYPRLARVRFYDMRHTANTMMLENPDVPYNVIEHYMGHRVNSQTKRLYDHIRDANIQKGAEALRSGHYVRVAAEQTRFIGPPQREEQKQKAPKVSLASLPSLTRRIQ